MFPNLPPDLQLDLVLRSIEERRAPAARPRLLVAGARMRGRGQIGRLRAARMTVGRTLVGLGKAIAGQPAAW